MAEIAAMEQAELALMAMEEGTMDSNSIAQWEQEMAAIERTLLGETSEVIAIENIPLTIPGPRRNLRDDRSRSRRF